MIALEVSLNDEPPVRAGIEGDRDGVVTMMASVAGQEVGRPPGMTAAMAVGAFLVVNAVGIMVDVEALRFIGLTGNVLLAPAWAIGMGISLWRSP
mgnify:CR=1 FL=1